MSPQVLMIAMTGLPEQSAWVQPMEAARERWPKERRSSGPNQRWLRRDWGFFLGIEVLCKAKAGARSRVAAGSRRPSSNHLRKGVYFRSGYLAVSIFRRVKRGVWRF